MQSPARAFNGKAAVANGCASSEHQHMRLEMTRLAKVRIALVAPHRRLNERAHLARFYPQTTKM